MNEGLNPAVISPDDLAYSDKWWVDTKKQVNAGFKRFCEKRNMRVVEFTERERVSASFDEYKRRRR